MTVIGKRLALGAAALLLAGLVPAGPAVAAPAESTVRGSVSVGGQPLAGVRVGTWSPRAGQVATTVTDARGSFALRSPSTLAVDVWVGVAPSSSHAVFAAGGRHLVRAVIGRVAGRDRSDALPQRVVAATPSAFGGRALAFRLQEAGRFTSSVPAGGTGRIALVRGGDTSIVGTTRDGVVDSGWLVPGSYRVRWAPDAGRLPVTTAVRVVPGTTAVEAPSLPSGTTLSIRVTCGGRPVGAGVPVLRTGALSDTTVGATDGSGVVTLRGLLPGTRRYVVGRYGTDTADSAPAEPPTDDRHLPSAPIAVTTRAGQATAEAAVDLRPASSITGRVAVRGRHPVLVVAEDAHGDPVRSTTASRGAFSLGGLTAGSYRVVAEDQDARVYAASTVTVPSGSTAAVAGELVPRLADPVLSGRLQGSGSVRLRAAVDLRVFTRDGVAGADGRFRIAVLPGRFVPVSFVGGRSQSIGRAVRVATSSTLHLPVAPRTAGVRGRPQVQGNAVPVAPRLQGDRVIDEEFLQGPRSVDTYAGSTDGGRYTAVDLPAGVYRFAGVDAPVPAVDGPWSYRAASRSFRLRAGRTTDLGVVRVRIAG